MTPEALKKTVNTLPLGRYAVGVSGGADSSALLCLLSQRPDLQLVTVHLNHQLRAHESDADETFVQELSQKLNIPCVIADRTSLEQDFTNLPTNSSAKYRFLRLELFKQVIERYQLDGVVLAHHADDQAETVLLRLIRGHTEISLAGIQPIQQMDDLIIHRPLLTVPRQALHDYLKSINQPWREDASNQSDDYRRNIIRKMLATMPGLTEHLLSLSSSCSTYKNWLDEHSPVLPSTFATKQLHNLPDPMAHYAIRQWLITRGAPAEDISTTICQRLLTQCTDAATPNKQNYPGGLTIHRKQGQISCL